jgi:hypothetical protein
MLPLGLRGAMWVFEMISLALASCGFQWWKKPREHREIQCSNADGEFSSKQIDQKC